MVEATSIQNILNIKVIKLLLAIDDGDTPQKKSKALLVPSQLEIEITMWGQANLNCDGVNDPNRLMDDWANPMKFQRVFTQIKVSIFYIKGIFMEISPLKVICNVPN